MQITAHVHGSGPIPIPTTAAAFNVAAIGTKNLGAKLKIVTRAT